MEAIETQIKAELAKIIKTQGYDAWEEPSGKLAWGWDGKVYGRIIPTEDALEKLQEVYGAWALAAEVSRRTLLPKDREAKKTAERHVLAEMMHQSV